MMRASYIRYPLHFKRPAGTSRGILTSKECWYLVLEEPGRATGIGEVSFIPGLSVETADRIEAGLEHLCRYIERGEFDPEHSPPDLPGKTGGGETDSQQAPPDLPGKTGGGETDSQHVPQDLPGIRFALETALADLESGGNRLPFPSDFTEGRAGIPTNGLIWMGDRRFMTDQVRDKIDQGFRVLKLKVGALDFSEELEILRRIRREYAAADLEIRLDANGAWSPEEAEERMEELARFGIHSIEQPIAAGQPEALAELSAGAAIRVALDEELIGIADSRSRKKLIEQIRPAYIILKPGLLGGFSVARDWIRIAEGTGSGWWVTSALESTVGLSAIAQWTFTVAGTGPGKQTGIRMHQGLGTGPGKQTGIRMHQGLGTGQIYSNNIPSPLEMDGEMLWYRPEKKWGEI